MSVELRLPELGENIESGQVSSVYVSVGDRIEVEQPLLEIETDKAAIEIPSEHAGTVAEVRVSEGDEIAVGAVVAVLEEAAGEEAGRPSTESAPPSEEEAETAAPQPEPASTDTEPEEGDAHARAKVLEIPRDRRAPVAAAPSVRRFARELGIDLHQVTGTGPAGRISREDVKAAVKQVMTSGAPARASATGRPMAEVPLPDFAIWGKIERKPLSRIRKTIATNLSAAWATVPHVTQHDLADVTSLEGVRKAYAGRAEELGGKLTITAILLKVVAMALKVFPHFNASIDMSAGEIIYKRYYGIGVAVDTDRGLLVPVVRDVDRKSILDISVELTTLAERARNRKMTLDEMQGASFTVTNLGGIGGTSFTPIVNAPEVAILGVSRTRTEPVWRHDRFEPRKMLPLSLSYDHRVIDGADGARFLRWICDALEKPLLTLLEEG